MKRALTMMLLMLFLTGCVSSSARSVNRLAADFEARYQGVQPQIWGERMTGVEERLPGGEKILALSLDACGSDGDGYDRELIEYLRAEKIPASLFVNARWIDKNPEIFRELASDPLFGIENHGTRHQPASVTGRSVYGIRGTESAAALVKEVENNARKIESITGRKPVFYRSGTAYYDDAAVRVIRELGYRIAGFHILGDRGATFSREEVRQALLSAEPGSIVILHMNHPEKETAEGVRLAVPELRQRGYRFVKLGDVPRSAKAA